MQQLTMINSYKFPAPVAQCHQGPTIIC